MGRASILAPLLSILCATACALDGRPGGSEKAAASIPYNLIAPESDRSKMTAVERRGYDLYLYDIAAARATVEALAEMDLAGTGSRGWIVVPYESGLLVRFIDRADRAEVDISVDPYSALTPLVMRDVPPKLLSPRERAMWRARQLVLDQPFVRCADRYNPVVLPETDAPDSPWLVYLLATSDDPHQVVLAGHQKFRVDAEGRTVLEHVPLSRSCLTVSAKADPSTYFITHDASSEPVETQVYSSLAHGLTLFVGVVEPRRSWKIDGGRVRAMD
ncbi:hypothetical protein K2X89_12380 [Myxococcota bacterium]|nr:hypothetical protein [Myxococcota bacterium]